MTSNKEVFIASELQCNNRRRQRLHRAIVRQPPSSHNNILHSSKPKDYQALVQEMYIHFCLGSSLRPSIKHPLRGPLQIAPLLLLPLLNERIVSFSRITSPNSPECIAVANLKKKDNQRPEFGGLRSLYNSPLLALLVHSPPKWRAYKLRARAGSLRSLCFSSSGFAYVALLLVVRFVPVVV